MNAAMIWAQRLIDAASMCEATGGKAVRLTALEARSLGAMLSTLSGEEPNAVATNRNPIKREEPPEMTLEEINRKELDDFDALLYPVSRTATEEWQIFYSPVCY